MYGLLPDFKKARVLIVGDIMLDRYWHGDTSRISPEAPVPVVHVREQTERPGGAGNVALNITALQGQATLIGIVGQDSDAETLREQLQQQQVQCDFIIHPAAPTVTKLRVLSRHQQLIRLDFEDSFYPLKEDRILARMRQHMDNTQVIVLSDYGKGALSDTANLIQTARMANRLVLIDPKGTNFDKYRNATLITPNRAEFEAVVGSCANNAQIVEKGRLLIERLNLQGLLITRSEQGMTLLRRGHEALHLPAQAQEVYDVTGAGDTVIGVLALALAAGEDWVNATMLSNRAAGLTVARLGAATVTPYELENSLQGGMDRGIHSIDSLLATVKRAQNQHEKVVMTNGCFDILHAGHVQYLRQARQLGDRLIVAVNDDDSVRRLKGRQRPINSLAQRMAVLSALECVDWVVPFSEDTPENLITQVLPDILVKGGDYHIEDIAGGQAVLANGGRVLVLNFLAGCSTTALIEAIQSNGEAQ